METYTQTLDPSSEDIQFHNASVYGCWYSNRGNVGTLGTILKSQLEAWFHLVQQADQEKQKENKKSSPLCTLRKSNITQIKNFD